MKNQERLALNLRTAWIVVTYACNNKCNFCYAQSMVKKFIEGEGLVHMPLKFAYQLVDEFKKIGIKKFHLIGGEPTIYPHLIDLVRYIKKDKSCYLAIVTNGRRMGDETYLQDLIDAGVDGFQVSIQGANAERHNMITGSCSFDMSYKALLNLARFKFHQFSSAITVSKDNCDQIEDFIRLMKEEIFTGDHSGKIFINFAAPSINFDSPNLINGDYALNPKEVADFVIKIDSLFPHDSYPEIIFSSRVPLCLYPADFLEKLIRTKRMSSGCSCGVHNVSIVSVDPQGDVLPCTNFAGTSLFNCCDSNGNFSVDFFVKGVNKYFPKIKKITHSYPSKTCSGCSKLSKCFGACLFWWTYFDPNEYIKNTPS